MTASSRNLLVAATFVSLAMAGCLESGDSADAAALDPELPYLALPIDGVLNFTQSVVTAAVGFAADLYEPTMEVSDTGVIYVTGHTAGVDTTGAPVFFSRDDGATWAQLPFTSTLTMPEPLPGATPPVTDEIFVVAGDDGWLYGVDITAATFPVNAWADDGGRHAYYNPNAYDRTATATTDCAAAQSLNDRPWAAYANGTLLMISNPGSSIVQLGVMDVPMESPVGAPGNPVTGPRWNVCASEPGSYIPGIPDIRDDHFFAVPNIHATELRLITGYAHDIFDLDEITVFNVTSAGPGTSNYGQAVFDAAGTMFVGIRNNTYEIEEVETEFGMRERRVPVDGQLKLAVSTDGVTFTDLTVRLGSVATSMYLDGNKNGEGALLTWAQEGDSGTDWYAAHIFLGANGAPEVREATLIVDEGPAPSAHVQGASVGPDGRAYFVLYTGSDNPFAYVGSTPLSVMVQGPGTPTLPVDLASLD